MKTRKGFVSNSSSTSFCIYGAHIGEEDMREIFGVEDDEDYDIYDEIFSSEKMKEWEEKGIDVFMGYEYFDAFVGIQWKNIGDDETGKEFKARVEALIKDIFGEDAECHTFDEVIDS